MVRLFGICAQGSGMLLRAKIWRSTLVLSAALPALALSPARFGVIGDDPGSWPRILGAVGITQGVPCNLFILRSGVQARIDDWPRRVEGGAMLILEGASPAAELFGFRATPKKIPVQSIRDIRAPKLAIVWETPLELPITQIPPDAVVFTRERWQGAPLVAGLRRGKGFVLWLAAHPGPRGYERFPYLLHALHELGLQPPFASRRLWAFFDWSYRTRVDLDYFAERWRKAGISALHVAAWHFNEPDAERDAYLRRLIEACHRRAILVYAWIELPHVSEKFWQDHPQWREKTALLQDAHLDWRKLMNLQNRDCFREVSRHVQALVDRFDWDGVNLGELYFESLEGASNPARFTPFNDDVRRRYQRRRGVDPVDVVRKADQQHLADFLEFRAELAREMQTEWIAELEKIRARKPHLDLVLTHVDDRFDTRMRQLIGADAAGLLPLLEQHDFTFLIEDPATVWHLGPERYPQIAARYHPLTRRRDKLAIDINIVERYQDVYPTKQQTGSELFQLVRLSSEAFPRVALYFENSILPQDLALLPFAAGVVEQAEHRAGKLMVRSPWGVGLRRQGPALVNGRPWPFFDDEFLWLPAGAHAVEPGGSEPPLRILDFNGDLQSAVVRPDLVEFSYRSSARAIARLAQPVSRVEIDGQPYTADGEVLILPRGHHIVTLRATQTAVSQARKPH